MRGQRSAGTQSLGKGVSLQEGDLDAEPLLGGEDAGGLLLFGGAGDAGEEHEVGADLADAEEDRAGVFGGLGALDCLERARVRLAELAEEIGGAGGSASSPARTRQATRWVRAWLATEPRLRP